MRSLCRAVAAAFLSTMGAAGAQELPAVERVTLAEALQRARTHNTSTRAAVAQVKLAYAQMEEVRAAAFPTLNAGATYTRLDADRTLASSDPAVPPRVILPSSQLAASLTASLPLVAPRAWANWARAADQLDVTRVNELDIERLVAVATARAYLTIYVLHLSVDANLQARDTALAHQQFAQRRLSGGVGNRIDLVRASQELSTDESQVQTSYSQLARAREALGVLMGVDGTAIDVVDASAQLPAPPTLQDALHAARAERSDILVNEARVHAADRSLGWSYTEYLPTLFAVGQVFEQNYASLTTPKDSWQVQLILNFPLYDGGLRYGLTHEREAALTVAKLNLEGALRQAESDTRAAFEAVQRADLALTSARKAAEDSHEALKLADLAYRGGATTDLDLVDAQRRARDADNASAVAEDNDLQARLDLLNASGLFPERARAKR